MGYNYSSRGHVEIKMDKERGRQRKVLNSMSINIFIVPLKMGGGGGVRLNILRVCGNQNGQNKMAKEKSKELPIKFS